MHTSDVMKSQIKLSFNKKWHYAILGYLLKDKYMKEVVSEKYVLITSSTHKITRQNECQLLFLDKLVLENSDQKLMINKIIFQCRSLHHFMIMIKWTMVLLNQQF